MTELTTYHLFGDGYSGRGVRVRELTPDDADAVEAEAMRANKEAGHDDGFDFMRLRVRLSLTRMIVAVTAPGVGVAEGKAAREAAIKTATEAAAPELEKLRAGIADGSSTSEALAARLAVLTAEAHEAGKAAAEAAASNALLNAHWIPVNTLALQTPENPMYFSKIFKVKDSRMLGVFYHRTYDAMESEANDIMGKALKVSTG